MLVRLGAVLSLLLCAAPSVLTAQPEKAQQRTSTPELVQHFAEFRMGFAQRPGYTGSWENEDEREAVTKALEEDRSADFLSLSERWLEKCPVDGPIHYLRASKLEESGDALGAIYHWMMFYGLLTSIMASGDGQTEASAYKVISVDEEYTLLGYLHAKVKKQALRGHCDVMEVDRGGMPSTVYFDVSIPLRAYDGQIESGTKKP